MKYQFAAEYEAEYVRDLPSRTPDLTIKKSTSWLQSYNNISVTTATGLEWWAEVAIPSGVPSRSISGLYSTPNPQALLVLSGGIPYRVPVMHPVDYEVLPVYPFVRALKCLHEVGLILMYSGNNISALDADGIRWESERLAMYRFEVEGIANGVVYGIGDPGESEERTFSIDIDSGRTVGGIEA